MSKPAPERPEEPTPPPRRRRQKIGMAGFLAIAASFVLGIPLVLHGGRLLVNMSGGEFFEELGRFEPEAVFWLVIGLFPLGVGLAIIGMTLHLVLNRLRR